MGVYAAVKTWVNYAESADLAGALLFGAVSVFMLLTAVLHWYTAVGFAIGRLDAVHGSLSAATLTRGRYTVVASAKVQFMRKLHFDSGNEGNDPDYIFFVCKYRPWVCPAAGFAVL